MIEIAVSIMLNLAPPATPVLCPPYPGDPPWRPMTCFILTRLGTPPDRVRWRLIEPSEDLR